ncbi:hypothetical protein D3C83_198360 [compost metagenome]
MKIRNEGLFQLGIRSILEIKIERFNDDSAWRVRGGGIVVGDIDLRVAATAEAFEDVVAAIKSALLKLQFRH